MHVLITGASGFVGSLLVPRLCADGHAVRALGRDPVRVRAALARGGGGTGGSGDGDPQGIEQVEIVHADVLDADRGPLTGALAGIEVAYYLVHSIERLPGAGPSFAARDRQAAENFAAAAVAAGVRRIVYLGGLLPRTPGRGAGSREQNDTSVSSVSRHLASREDVERVLLAAVPDSLALRASIVIGAQSRSFRLLVHLLERMPVLALPTWHTFRTQPIDERDVIEMLAACAGAQPPRRSLDIGGPVPISYGEMLQKIAELMLINRPTVRLGVTLNKITARLAAAMAGEDPELVVALMEGLNGDLLPSDDHADELLGVRLHSFDAAVEHALAEWEREEPLAAR